MPKKLLLETKNNAARPKAITTQHHISTHFISATMFRAPEAMQSWLSEVSDSIEHDGGDNETRPRKRPRLGLGIDMATPSTSIGRSASPSKRRRTDDNDHDANLAPLAPLAPLAQHAHHAAAASWPSPLATRTVHSLTSIPSGAAFSMNPPSTMSRTRRSASPVKNIAGLKLLEKPVHFDGFPDDAESVLNLPDDVRQLYSNIYSAVESKHGIYPAEIRSKIEGTNPLVPPAPSAFREPLQQQQQQQQTGSSAEQPRHLIKKGDYIASILATASGVTVAEARASLEFEQVCGIRDAAKECMALRRSEAAWNALVHGPVLDLAFPSRGNRPILVENATAARILPCFLPAVSAGGSGLVDSKLVDFTLTPNLGPEFDATIQLNNAVTIADLCVNQTEYHPLQRFPVAVSIETKIAGANLEEGRMQLAIWTAAWHKRMALWGLGAKFGCPLPTLPLILTHDQEWKLFFAVDHPDKIVRCPFPLVPCLLAPAALFACLVMRMVTANANKATGDSRPSTDWHDWASGKDIPAACSPSSCRGVDRYDVSHLGSQDAMGGCQ